MSIIVCIKKHCNIDENKCCAVCEKKCANTCKCIICNNQMIYKDQQEYEEYRSRGFKCHNCEDTYPKDAMHEGCDGEQYCSGCFYDIFATCDSCGEVMYQDDSWGGANGDDSTYCRSCYDEHYTSCEVCGETVDNDDAHHTTRDRYLCSSCTDSMNMCSECGDTIESGEVEIDGDFYCTPCAERRRRRA
jgi:hypothetical protein